MLFIIDWLITGGGELGFTVYSGMLSFGSCLGYLLIALDWHKIGISIGITTFFGFAKRKVYNIYIWLIIQNFLPWRILQGRKFWIMSHIYILYTFLFANPKNVVIPIDIPILCQSRAMRRYPRQEPNDNIPLYTVNPSSPPPVINQSIINNI